MICINKFIEQQLEQWPTAKQNYDALRGVETKQIGWAKAQFNPARIVSTGAKVDAAAIAKRACFLCDANRPTEQISVDWGEYWILVNPFPILPRHLTIPHKKHIPQRIKGRMGDMCRLAELLPDYVVFYNGPKCGASAPDHFHFQAGNASFLPDYEQQAPFGKIAVISERANDIESIFDAIYDKLEAKMAGEEDPMMNLLCRYFEGKWHLTIIPRKSHRPSFYGSDEGEMLVSPASVDLAGVVITPLRKDFDAIDEDALARIYGELCYTQEEINEMMKP